MSVDNSAAATSAAPEKKPMRRKVLWTVISLAVAAVAFLLIVVRPFYNEAVPQETKVNLALAQYNNVLQQQADQIPNLADIVKGGAAQENKTVREVAEARSNVQAVSKIDPTKVSDPKLQEQIINAQKDMNKAMVNLRMVTEQYPELKSNELYKNLMVKLEGANNRVGVERQRAQKAIGDWNNFVNPFPNIIVAKLIGYHSLPYFEAEPEARKMPKVDMAPKS
jgi:LemA protein